MRVRKLLVRLTNIAILGALGVVLLVAIVLARANSSSRNLAPKVANASPVSQPVKASDINTDELLKLTNEDRAAAKIVALQLDPALNASAQARCGDMATRHYYDHDAPDGTKWFESIKKVEPNYVRASENIATYFSNASTAGVNQDWMNSAGHKANILEVSFTNVGFATCLGEYQNKSTLFVVAQFTQIPKETLGPSVHAAPAAPAGQSASDIAYLACVNSRWGKLISLQRTYSGNDAIYTQAVNNASAADPHFWLDTAYQQKLKNMYNAAVDQAYTTYVDSFAGEPCPSNAIPPIHY